MTVKLGDERIKMKTEIDANGKLKISPESEIESFALKMWWADYNSIHSDVGGEEHFAALHVETIVPVIAPNV